MYVIAVSIISDASKKNPVPTTVVTKQYNIGKYHRVCGRQKTMQIGSSNINAMKEMIVNVGVKAPFSSIGVNGKINPPMTIDMTTSTDKVSLSHFLVTLIVFAFSLC